MLAIALALGASACWGPGDFLGGLTTRRASLWAVVIGSLVLRERIARRQLAGVVLTLAGVSLIAAG